MKQLILIAFLIASFGYSFTQVPNYVPANGLVAWYPFNGNANDESGNGKNGTVNGSGLTTDRCGNANRAYSQINAADKISINALNNDSVTSISVSGWFNKSSNTTGATIFSQSNACNGADGLRLYFGQDNFIYWHVEKTTCQGMGVYNNQMNFSDDNWHFFVAIYNKTSPTYIESDFKLFIDGVSIGLPIPVAVQGISSPVSNNQFATTLGNLYQGADAIIGKIDDFGIWNRVLTNQEIQNLYTSLCNDTCNVTVYDTVIITNTIYDTTAINIYDTTYVSVFDTTSIIIRDTITTNIYVFDTSYVTIYDTINEIVNDTLVFIDTIAATGNCETLVIKIVGIGSPNNISTITIYPNPADKQIIIDNENYVLINGYMVKINDINGAQKFLGEINQQFLTIDISNGSDWPSGTYFVQILDLAYNVIITRKIIISRQP